MATSKAKIRGAAPESESDLPDIASGDGFELDRITSGINTSISNLHMVVGELKSSIASQTGLIKDIQADCKDLDSRIVELKTEQVSTSKAVKFVGLIATPIVTLLITLAAWFAPAYWNAAMRPEMEKNIAAAVKADIEKEQAARERTNALERQVADLQAKLAAQAK